jgi:hypothetical protein
MDEVQIEATRRGVKLVIALTEEAIDLNKQPEGINAVRHITC